MDIYHVEANEFPSPASPVPTVAEPLDQEDFRWNIDFACIYVENYTALESAIAISSVGIFTFASTQLLNDISTVPIMDARFFNLLASIMSGLILGCQTVPLMRLVSNTFSCMRARPQVTDNP